jgi:hypothetical protein
MRQFVRKKKEHVEISCPIDLFAYISHMGNVDLLISNIVSFHMEMDIGKGISEFSVTWLTHL